MKQNNDLFKVEDFNETYKIPEIFYKYKSVENWKFICDIIMNNRLYAASYPELNDPMEAHYYLDGRLDGRLRTQFKNVLLVEKRERRICSLSCEEDNEIMWGHYANGGRGIRIGVKVNSNNCVLKRINYVGIPEINYNDHNNFQETASYILTHKTNAWAYEQEIRAFSSGGNFISVEIVSIKAGKKMLQDDFDCIKKMLKCKGINFDIVNNREIIINH